MKIFFINSIIALCVTCLYAQTLQQPHISNEFGDIIASLKSYDEQDGNYLIQINKKRVEAQISPIEYDAGLIRMASKISFDLAQGDVLFRPEIDDAEKMPIAGCAFKISKNIKINVERYCFGNMYNTDLENNDCKLFDAQKDQREIEKYGFGRETNPTKGIVYIVRLFGILNRVKPVEVESTTMPTFKPVEVEVTTGANVNPVEVEVEVTTGANVNPVEVEVTTGANVDPVEVEVTTGANVEPVVIELTTSADVNPVEVKIANDGSNDSPYIVNNPENDQLQSPILTSTSKPKKGFQIPIKSQTSLGSEVKENKEAQTETNQLETSIPDDESLETTTIAYVKEARPAEIPVDMVGRIRPQLDNYLIQQSHSPRFNLLSRLINLKRRLRMLRKSLRQQHSVMDEDVFEETDKRTTQGLKSSFRSKRRHIVKDTKF